MRRLPPVLVGLALMAACLFEGAHAQPARPIVGAVEEVWLAPWGTTVRARIDTGARLSSLDARDIEVRGSPGRQTVQFTLVVDDGREISGRLPLVRFETVKATEGAAERRPTVRIEVCLAGARRLVDLTLNDRRGLEYRMLVGRNLLHGRFLVDVALELTASPPCPRRP